MKGSACCHIPSDKYRENYDRIFRKPEVKDDGVVYIIAGSWQQAALYCRQNEIPLERILAFPRDLLARPMGIKVKIVGSWYDRLDWGEFHTTLCVREAIIIRD